MGQFSVGANTLQWTHGHEKVLIEPWGPDSLRVRATTNAELATRDWTLLPPPPTQPPIEAAEDEAVITNGRLQARISKHGHIRFIKASTGELLLQEAETRVQSPALYPPARLYQAVGGDLFYAEARFQAQSGERLWGLGQHRHGLLDQKGAVIDLLQRNCEVSIPFLVSSRGYGFLWHNPAVGRVELGTNHTRWVASATRQIDYYVTTGDSLAELLAHYADATGHAPMLPGWAAGFWQSKLRYRTQEELMAVVRGYKERGLPLSVIVIDFYHWPRHGDWDWDREFWPDLAGMVRELDSMGIKLMVSIWGAVNPNSRHAAALEEHGLLVRTERGHPALIRLQDTWQGGRLLHNYYDATNPEARRFIWQQVREHYYKIGVKAYWLDACEPEIYPLHFDNLRFYAGPGQEVANIYPLLHERGFYEGLRAEGEQEVITLCRSAWAGSQRYGAAVWSGDIPSTFESLQAQVRAGLSIGLSGIPWWTTDIGGFFDGDVRTAYFRELIVRWFQYGVYCPLFRLHGIRLPMAEGRGRSGGDNEVWSFGEEAYAIIKDILFLRERLRPYIMEQMRLASIRGTPPMRPLFFDFRDDPGALPVEDEFLFGPDILVAPVLEYGARGRDVYLPGGTQWTDAYTGQRFEGGQWVHAEAPLERIPVYLREGSKLSLWQR